MNISKWILIAISLICIGLVIFAVAMAALGWDFTKLSSIKCETNTHEITEDFENILIDTDTPNVTFVKSESGTAKVICYEQVNMKHTVRVENGTLTVKANSDVSWYDRIGFNFSELQIEVYLPEQIYNDLTVITHTGDVDIPSQFKFSSISVTTSTGNIRNYACADGAVKLTASSGDIFLKDITASDLELTVSTGDVTVIGVAVSGDVNISVSTGDLETKNLTGVNLTTTGNTGDIELENTVFSGELSIERTSGDVELEACDAAKIYIKTSTGDVEGTLLSDKTFSVHTSTGDVRVPDGSSGGKCEITTSTGDIEIRIIK